MGSLVDEIEIGLAVNAAEGRVGQLEHVDVLDVGSGRNLAQSQFHCLSSAHVPCSYQRRQYQDTCRHESMRDSMSTSVYIHLSLH